MKGEIYGIFFRYEITRFAEFTELGRWLPSIAECNREKPNNKK